MDKPIIEVRSLERTYRKGPRALKGVSLDVARAARFALLGPNGAGKSTLTRILCTLSRGDSGSVRVDGIPYSGGTQRIRSRIGVALQDIQVDPESTARDQLRFQGRLYGMDARAAADRAEELLARFGLADAAVRKAKDLSGGNKRRLHVALALVHRPGILFLDEPTVGMDPEARALFWGEIRRLNREEGVTVFFTTQYLEEAERNAESLAVIDDGLVVYRGTPGDFAREFAAGDGSGKPGSLEEGYLAFVEARRGRRAGSAARSQAVAGGSSAAGRVAGKEASHA